MVTAVAAAPAANFVSQVPAAGEAPSVIVVTSDSTAGTFEFSSVLCLGDRSRGALRVRVLPVSPLDDGVENVTTDRVSRCSRSLRNAAIAFTTFVSRLFFPPLLSWLYTSDGDHVWACCVPAGFMRSDAQLDMADSNPDIEDCGSGWTFDAINDR